MTAVHLHLLVVHLPVVGSLCTAVLLALGLWFTDHRLIRISCAALVLCALFGIAAYYSGPSSYEILEAELVADKEFVEQHALIARAAFTGLILAGAIAVQISLQYLQGETSPRWLLFVLLAITLLLCYVLAWTAHLGGTLRHPEIRQPTLSIFPSLAES